MQAPAGSGPCPRRCCAPPRSALGVGAAAVTFVTRARGVPEHARTRGARLGAADAPADGMGRRHGLAKDRGLMDYETVDARAPRRRSCASRSNRPEAMNAWNKQFGRGPARRGARPRPSDDAVRAVVDHGRRARRSPRAPTSRRASTRRRRATRTSQTALRERYHPIITGHPRGCPSRCWRPSTAPRSGSAARSRWPPTWSIARESRLLPARLREHRPGARRRLVAVRARARRLRAARPRWRCSASASRAGQALEWGLINRVAADDEFDGRGRRAGRSAWPTGPTALLRGHQAPAQRVAVRADGRAAGARGRDPAGVGGVRRLPRGRAGVPREAPARIRGPA